MLYPMKKYRCHCHKCGNDFHQNVQKGVDNGYVRRGGVLWHAQFISLRGARYRKLIEFPCLLFRACG